MNIDKELDLEYAMHDLHTHNNKHQKTLTKNFWLNSARSRCDRMGITLDDLRLALSLSGEFNERS